MPLDAMLASAFLALLGIVLLLNIFGLPANWLILGLAALWQWLIPWSHMGILFWVAMFAIAILGEVLETGLQLLKAKKYGSTSSGTWGGMIGAIIGAIVLAPLFFGFGAFLGAMGGAWIGCYLFELLKGRPQGEAWRAAWGALTGRFLGTVCKLGIGAVMIVLIWHQIWPTTLAEPLPIPPEGIVV